MPNFNTKEMKVAFSRKKGDGCSKVERLPDESIEQLKAAVEYAIDSERDIVMAVAFIGYFIHKDDQESIKKSIEDEEATIVCFLLDTIVIKTSEESIVTVKLMGGADDNSWSEQTPQAAATKKRKRDSDHGDNGLGGLTQECDGVLDALLDSF